MLDKILEKFPWLTKLTVFQWVVAISAAVMIVNVFPPIAEAWFDKNYERNAMPRRMKVYSDITEIRGDIGDIKTDTRDIKNILMSRNK